jgi:methylaspartate mutase epsilon subunit
MENFLQTQKIEVEKEALDTESAMVEKETRCIMDRLLEFGDGDVMDGTIKAVKSGVLDNPFATNPASPCKVMSIKDSDGALRYLNHGNLPFTAEILEFHKGKIVERENKKGKKLDYETLVSDLLAVSKGVLTE